jgi:hypothetical protein
VAPTTPPTIAWVVDTGMEVNVASARNNAAPIRAESIAIAFIDICELQ